MFNIRYNNKMFSRNIMKSSYILVPILPMYCYESNFVKYLNE